MDQIENKTQTELELDIEIRQIKSLIALCDDGGLLSPISAGEVDIFADAYYRDRTELGLISLRSRLRVIHRALHEVLYAPKNR